MSEGWVAVGTLLTAPLLPMLHLAIVWLRRDGAALRWACALYGVVCVALLIGIDAVTPRSALVVGSLWLTLCLGYLQVVSMITRSISLRLLVELDQNPGASRDALFRDYADGRGFDWLLDKRLSGLVHVGLIRRDASGLTATDRGVVVGRFALATKRLLALDETG
ncbi:MAG: hypothetical protein AAGE94_02460 [Acidobacteriota bacterium]